QFFQQAASSHFLCTRGDDLMAVGLRGCTLFNPSPPSPSPSSAAAASPAAGSTAPTAPGAPPSPLTDAEDEQRKGESKRSRLFSEAPSRFLEATIFLTVRFPGDG